MLHTPNRAPKYRWYMLPGTIDRNCALLERPALVWIVGLFAFAIACGSPAADAKPTEETPTAIVQQSEAISYVKGHLSEVRSVTRPEGIAVQDRVQESDPSMLAPGERSCLEDLEERTNYWIGAYLGEGIWEVRAEFKGEWLGSDVWRWNYYTDIGAVFTPQGQAC